MTDGGFAQMTGIRDDGMVQFGSDDRMFVQFSVHKELQGNASREAGHPVHKDVDYIRIQQPGERDFTFRPVREDDKFRWPRHWAAFQADRTSSHTGMPLDLLFPHEPSVVESLKYRGVHTVEMLANISDGGLQNLGMGARDMQKRAQDYIATAEKGKQYHEFQAELQKRDEKIELLTQQVQALLSSDDDKPRRGRPRKITEGE